MARGDTSGLRLFAAELAAKRAKAGLSQEDLAVQLHYSLSLVTSIECMRRAPSPEFAKRCDALWDTGGTFERMQDHARMLSLPAWIREYNELESAATSLRSWQPIVVDGLVQTPEYARALLSTRVGATADEIEMRVLSRLERQETLERDTPPLLWILLDECALRRPVGGPAVMQAQAEHIAELAERPSVIIQIVRTDVGAHDGVNGAFVIADFADAPGIVYLETALTGLVVDRPEQVTAARVSYEGLKAEALPRTASLDFIREMAKEWI